MVSGGILYRLHFNQPNADAEAGCLPCRLATGKSCPEEDIPKLAGYLMDSDAIFNTLVSVSTSNPFGIEIEDEATRADLVEGIEEFFAQSGKSQREREICIAIAKILGVDDMLNLG